RVSGIGDGAVYLRDKSPLRPFVRMQDEEPGVLVLHLVQGGFTLGAVVVEGPLHDTGPGGAGDLHGAVLAVRVEDHDIVAPAHRFEAAGQVRLFVAGQDQDRDHGVVSPSALMRSRRTCRNFAGLPPTTVNGSTSLTTTARAAATAPALTVTPGPTNTSA